MLGQYAHAACVGSDLLLLLGGIETCGNLWFFIHPTNYIGFGVQCDYDKDGNYGLANSDGPILTNVNAEAGAELDLMFTYDPSSKQVWLPFQYHAEL